MNRKLRVNRMLLAAAMLGIAPLALLAGGPATQPVVALPPADAVAPSGDQAVDPMDFPPGPSTPADDGKNHSPDRKFPRQRFQQQLTPKELADARLFMQSHSPERYQAIQSLPDGDKKNSIETLAARAYVNWMRLAKEDSELYAVVVKRVELEDQIFGKVAQLKKAPAEKQDPLQAELKDLVGKLVDNGNQERRLRLDRLAKTIKDEQKKLDEDAANRSAVIEERIKVIQKTDSSDLIPNPGPGMGSGGGGQHGHGGGGGGPRQP